jgi:hypothetical protein
LRGGRGGSLSSFLDLGLVVRMGFGCVPGSVKKRV